MPNTIEATPADDGWRKKWLYAAPVYAIVAAGFSYFWFHYGPGVRGDHIRTIYPWPAVAVAVYSVGAGMLYYAAYAVATAVRGKARPSEARFHLIFWALVPPLWFVFEWFFLVQDYDTKTISVVRAGQDVVGKLWAAVLAVLLAVKLGDIAAKRESAPHA